MGFLDTLAAVFIYDVIKTAYMAHKAKKIVNEINSLSKAIWDTPAPSSETNSTITVEKKKNSKNKKEYAVKIKTV